MASPFKLVREAAKSTGKKVLTAAEKKAKAQSKDVYDPYAVRSAKPSVEAPAARPSMEELQRSGDVPTPGGRDTLARSIIRPTGDDVKWVTRPPQERSGVFDYSFKMPERISGVERYAPPRGVPERTTNLLGRQDVFDKMVAGVERGLPVKDWYEFGPVYKSFIDEFGPELGNQRFDAFVDAIASTSPRSDVGTNIRNATYWFGQATPKPGQNSIPGINDLPEKPTFPYGHLAQSLHRSNIAKTLLPGGGGFDPKSNPKPLSFAWNFRGDPNLVTVDTHAFRAPAMLGRDPNFLETSFLNEKGAVPRNIQREHAAGDVSMDEAAGRGAFWQSKPKENEYASWEDYYRRIANELGIKPAEAQAAGWVGHGAMTGLESAPKSAMDFVEERILKTAKERNMDPIDVWKQAIRGERPLTFLEKNVLGDVPGMSGVA